MVYTLVYSLFLKLAVGTCEKTFTHPLTMLGIVNGFAKKNIIHVHFKFREGWLDHRLARFG